MRLLFALLLAGTSVLELLRLWNLTQRLYPGAVTQLALCLLVLLPILYLRRVSAISQTAYVVLCLLCIATAGMLLSVFPRLHITNLQNAALIWPDFAAAARRPADTIPGISTARPLAGTAKARPPHTAAAGRCRPWL